VLNGVRELKENVFYWSLRVRC